MSLLLADCALLVLVLKRVPAKRLLKTPARMHSIASLSQPSHVVSPCVAAAATWSMLSPRPCCGRSSTKRALEQSSPSRSERGRPAATPSPTRQTSPRRLTMIVHATAESHAAPPRPAHKPRGVTACDDTTVNAGPTEWSSNTRGGCRRRPTARMAVGKLFQLAPAHWLSPSATRHSSQIV